MKHRIIAWLLCILLLGLTACGEQPSTTPEEDTTPTENDETVETDDAVLPEVLQSYLDQAGLTKLRLFSTSETATFAEGVTGQAYLLLLDNANLDEEFNEYAFVALVYGQNVLLRNLETPAMGGEVSAGDLDGDGHSDILVHATVGASGGAGNYDTRVFTFRQGQLDELFNAEQFDTGYAIQLLADKKYRITNRFTDYSAEFLREGQDETYFDFWYNEDGTIQENALLVDSFFECELTDTDQNGVYELSIKQYTSLVDHADYMGDAVSVLTYDKDSKAFKVTQTSFEPK